MARHVSSRGGAIAHCVIMKSSSSPSFFISSSDLDTVRTFLEHEDACSPLDVREREALVQRLRDATVLRDDTIAEDESESAVAGLQDLVTVEEVGTRPADSFSFTLVMPHEANFEDDHISVLSPLGAAVFGRRSGRVVDLDSPAGRRKIRVLAVFKKAAIH